MDIYFLTFVLAHLCLIPWGEANADTCIALGKTCGDRKNICCEGTGCEINNLQEIKGTCVLYDRMVGEDCDKIAKLKGDPDRPHRCISKNMACDNGKCVWKEWPKCQEKGQKPASACCQKFDWKNQNVDIRNYQYWITDSPTCPCSEEYHGCHKDSDCCDGKKLKCVPQKPNGRASIEKYCIEEK